MKIKYESGIILIIIGILSTIISFIIIDNHFKSQNDWIKADVSLSSIKTYDPLKTHNNTDTLSYYGEYIFMKDDTPIYMYSINYSDPKYIPEQTTFYINPDNYKYYHPEYNQNSKWISLLGLVFVALGIMFNINERKVRKNEFNN